MKFLVIGESCLDVFVYGNVVRLAPESPVPVFNSINSVENLGMASNVAANMRALDCDTTLYTNGNTKEIKKIRYVETKSNHMFLRVDENDDDYGHANLSGIDFSKYDCVVISDYDKGWLSTKQINFIGRKAKISILDTKKILGKWAYSISFIKINETEYARTKAVLSEDIIENLIVTLGPRGAMHREVTYPAPNVSRVDSAGAGDSFVSAFAKAYTESGSVHHAIEKGNEVASIVVQKKGVSTI
tara:strand:+ start:387 stop:1118 length:732 start_codon:yes stop_codon:yes gene_type:complete